MNVFIGVPTRGAVGWQTVTRLQEIRDAHPGLRPILWQPGNLSVALTRNRIVKAFMASPCDVLVMVDDDVVPPPSMLETLIGDHGYALAAIPHVMPDPNNQGRLILTSWTSTEPLRHGWNTVDAVATGCVAVTRDALVALGPAPFRIAHDPDAPIVSDDFLFCADLHERGYRIGAWLDGWHCDHITAVSLAPLLETQTRQSAATLRKESVLE